MALPEPHPDRRPGSDVSLLDFYDLVPVAEEFDLAGDAALERERRFWSRQLLDWGMDQHVDIDQATDVQADADGSEEKLSEGQVIGMLEHVLGARVVEVDPDES